MRHYSIIGLAVFAALVIVVFLLPRGCKIQMQAGLFETISPLLHTGAQFEQQLGGVSGGLKKLDELERENRQLHLENEKLRAANNLLKTSETEVNRLNRALGFKERSTFNLLPARVTARDNATWWTGCVIDRGSNDSIETDKAVVTENGLVGKVTTVSKNSSMIVLVSDENFRVTVNIEGTQENGILSGTRASATYAPELRIRFLSRNAEIKPGMKVVTAGTAGVIPPGLQIGVVKQFSVKQLEGIAEVEPSNDLAHLQDVFVVTGQR